MTKNKLVAVIKSYLIATRHVPYRLVDCEQDNVFSLRKQMALAVNWWWCPKCHNFEQPEDVLCNETCPTCDALLQ